MSPSQLPSKADDHCETTIDVLARELLDPATPEFSVAIAAHDFERVERRADEIEVEMIDAA